jgi:DNA-directed RNA polymerase subunit K/omega
MNQSIFGREVSFKVETLKNPFAACNIFSHRARSVNNKATPDEKIELNPTVKAFNDYSQGNITFVQKGPGEELDGEDK